MTLPPKLQSMTPYTPVTGNYPVRLDANESFMTPPYWLRREIADALSRVPLHRYPDPLALGVREKASSLYGIQSEQVIAGNGSDELIGLIMAALVPRGGRVLLTDPDFSMYQFYAELYELDCRAVGKIGRRPDIDAVLREAEQWHPDLVIFSNPCNPTGLGAPRGEVIRLLKGVTCPVVVDEAYMDFWDQSVMEDLPNFENLVILKTCSKACGLAGLRLGFAMAGPEIMDALFKTKSPYNVNALTQAAGEVVLSHPRYLRNCAEKIKDVTQALFDKLQAIAGRVGGALTVLSTETNFVLLQTPDAAGIFEGLRTRGILVRQLDGDLLRVTAGSGAEQTALFGALEEILPL